MHDRTELKERRLSTFGWQETPNRSEVTNVPFFSLHLGCVIFSSSMTTLHLTSLCRGDCFHNLHVGFKVERNSVVLEALAFLKLWAIPV